MRIKTKILLPLAINATALDKQIAQFEVNFPLKCSLKSFRKFLSKAFVQMKAFHLLELSFANDLSVATLNYKFASSWKVQLRSR